MDDSRQHVTINRRVWDDDAENWVVPGESRWAGVPRWGVWSRPDDEVPLIPSDLRGLDCVELGCGTAYGSAWMARRGARRVIGVDNSARQLATAARLAAEHDIDLHLIHGDAERLPLADGSVDVALSEYGAAIWCDPERWLAEAWRVLRPGGRLAFLGTHHLAHVAAPLDGAIPIERVFHRPWFGLRRLDWTEAVDEPSGIEFSLPTSEWVALFRRIGFVVLDYREPRPPTTGEEREFAITRAWAHSWPSEQAWWLGRP